MAHGGSRPGAGRKAGVKNKIPAKNVIGRNVCLPAHDWERLAGLASDRETTATKLAASIILNWLETR